MAISFDKVFGIHQHTMRVRNDRAEVLAGNLANADTPGYKARDIDFNTALVQQANLQFEQDKAAPMVKTNQRHMDLSDLEKDPLLTLKYRLPYQADTGNGNTVEVNSERMNYMSNSIEYQATMRFLNGKISKLKTALSSGN
ncbi:Putative proximal rod protein [Anaerobiospirillum thomasii]|uniref:Flagellar basal body rod protein FlgB n=1 Tax=Anaerobiospirillum thomasii TaxID=179995 RepID=A0A2X0VG35_9GAMM|nr:flagellar basal body rod protein FlgB [Anaerobiospirillum thomasii]SPT69489.1 Putative proximal rod protein [Anaerobiospirillum thomasii]SPT71955.1 Putative proximal rod protein [Anaerobiospirillum thomasii]